MSFLAVVPARAGSKGASGKNTRLLSGKPLWRWSVDQALSAGADEVLVSTDIEDVLSSGPIERVTFVRRPSELATDETPMAPVLTDLLEPARFAAAQVVLLQPTSPLREQDDILRSVSLHAKHQFDLVLTVVETNRGVLKYGTLEGEKFSPLRDPAHCFSNRQSLPPVFRPNGAVYVFGRDWFLRNGGFETSNIGSVIMSPEASQDIDTDSDFELAQALLKGR